MEAELQLIDKVELRITLSSSDEKFQQSLNTFLAPLLLKLASPHNQVRSKILKFVGHLMTRIGSSPDVKLPIQKLLQQAKSPSVPEGTNQNAGNVKLYSYLFVSKGLERENDLTAIVNYLPLVLNCIEEQSKISTTEGPAILARAFNIFCKLVAKFNEKSLKQFSIEFSKIYKSPDEFTTSFLNINKNKKGLDTIFSKTENIFLLLPNSSTSGKIPEFYHCPGLSNNEVKLLTYDAGVSFNYNNLNELKIKLLLFLSLLDIANDAVSKNSHFLLILFFATVDTNSAIKDIASNMLRKIDLSDAIFNNPVLIEAALQYYLGNDQRKSVPPQIQETLLTKIFMKSTKIFDYGGEKLAQISKIGFNSSLPKLKKSALLFAKYSSSRNNKSIGYSQDVKNFNTEMASTILQNIQNEGWPKLQLSNIPTMKVNSVLENRRLQYEALADLIRNEPKLLLDDELTYLKFFFNSVKGELHDNVSVVQDALAKLISNFSRFFHIEPDSDKKKKVAASLKIFFKNFLGRDINDTDADGDVEMQNTIDTKPEISSAVSSCRYLALKFTNALFEYNDVEARFLNIYGSLYSNRYDVVEASSKGLNPYWFNLYKSSLDIPEKTFYKLNETDSDSKNCSKDATSVLKTTKELLGLNSVNKLVFPSFTELVKQLQQEVEFYNKYPHSSLLPAVLADTFKYLLKILVMESVKGQSTVIVVDEDWDFRVEKALELDEKVKGLVTIFLKKTDAANGESKDLLTFYLKSIVNEYLSFNSISHQNKTLKNDLQSFNLVYKNIYSLGPIFNSIVSLTNANTINKIANKPLIENLLSLINIEVTDSSIKYNKTFYARLVQDETISILSKSIGIILSNGSLDTEMLKNIVIRLSTPIAHFTKSLQLHLTNSTISVDADFVIARLDIIGHLIGRLNVTKRLSDIVNIDSFFDELLSNYKLLFKSSYESKNWKHFQILLDGLNELSKYGALNANNISTNAQEKLSNVKELVKIRMKKSDEKSSLTWAYLSLVCPPSQPVREDNKTEKCEYLQALYDTHTFKQSEFLFASGEALTILASGWNSKVLTKTLDVQGYNIDAIKQLVLPKSTQSLEMIVAMVLKSCANTKPSLRKAACIWLLSLVKYCGHLEPVYSKSKEIHVAFMRYLAENDDLIQESASTGLSLIYEMGDSDLKETLVKGLIKSFTSSTSATNLTAGTISEETELFEPGILNTPDGSISTYKDILSLASEVGDPSLVYKFMSLTKSSALWASRKGIAFGLGNIMSKSNLEQLLQSNDTLTKNLIVKLYRYKFDPNENVSRSMSDIWNVLVPNSSKIIELNHNIILQELLTSISNREWRVRQAATIALIDLLQVLKIEMYEDKLEEIWTLAFRSMDDIKDSVRDSGTKLTKFLANNLIRSLENANNGATAKNYGKILNNLIPFLVGTKGILSGVEEVRSYSLSIILKLCMKAGNALKPFIPGLIEELLSLMSTLEPQIVNYLALNADKYNLKSSDIDAKRLTSVGHSPMMEAVERMLDLADDDLMKALVPKLNSAIKKSVGLPSKVAASKVLVTLVVKHLFLLNESYGASLLKTCIAQLNDRNETVAIAYANAAGYLCRVCKINAIVKYGNFLKDLYFNYRNEQDRKIAGVGCEAVAKFSTDKFSTIASFFLPLAFVCQNDESSSVADKFKSVWIENTGGKSAVKLYIDEICNIVTEQLQSQQYSIRQVCAKAIANACTLMSSSNVNSADQNIAGLNNDMVERLFGILLEACKGRSWNGKEVVLNALVTFTKNFKNKAIENDYELYHRVEKVVLVEAKRRNKQYQKESIKSLGLFAEVFPNSKLYDEEIQIIKPFLQDSFYEQSDSSDDDDDDDDDDKSAAKKIKTDKQYSKSSAVNYERETTNIDFLATLATSFAIEPITDSSNHKDSKALPLEMAKYIFTEAVPYFFQSAHVIPTWRSKLAVSQSSATVLERIAKCYNDNGNTNAQTVPVEWLSTLYTTLKTRCLEDPDIENVRVQAASAISVLLLVLSKYGNTGNEAENANHLREKISQDLKSAYDKDASNIVKVRIEKVLREGK